MIEVSAAVLDTATAFTSTWVAASSGTDSEGGPGLLLLSGPVAGVLFYVLLYRYYRNTDKSHSFEKETKIASQPVTGSDVKVDSVKGTQRTRVKGDNVSRHRDRVKRVGSLDA